MADIKKAKISDKLYDVVSVQDYNKAPDMYITESTAIENNGMLYPLRNTMDISRPGMFHTDPVNFFVHPVEEEREQYDANNIIDFNGNNIKDIIEAQTKLKCAERTILTSIDNLFIPHIDQNDDPEMKALKEAIVCKNIDIDKYANRFGKNFPNDKRILKKDSITMSKLKSVMEALDMKGTLIIEDKDPNVPNPIGKQIIAELTLRGDEEDDSEADDI